MENQAFDEVSSILEDVYELQSVVEVDEYFKNFETLNKGKYSFKNVEYHEAGMEPMTILCYLIPGNLTIDSRQVAFTAISTCEIPVYTPIMVRLDGDKVVGYPADQLKLYREHIAELNGIYE